MTLKELLDSLSFDEIAPFRIRHYHTIMRQEIWYHINSISIIFAVLRPPVRSL